MKKIIGVIPARFHSSRFPGKPLADILGKPMIWWVYRRAKQVDEFSNVIVATDDQRIYEVCKNLDLDAIITSETCDSGTERVAEVAKAVDGDLYINIQGDEPLIDPEEIRELIKIFEDSKVYYATLKSEINDENKINDPNNVKVITDDNDNAIYFSRSRIPYLRKDKKINVKYYRHVGIYGYTSEFLSKFVSLCKTELEQIEGLEQLRAIEHGYKVKVKETKYDSVGVDLPEHIRLVEEKIREKMQCY